MMYGDPMLRKLLAATADWQFMTYWRLGREEDAAGVLADVRRMDTARGSH